MAKEKPPCASSTKKLSKNLLLMKFMKKSAVKAELEEVDDEKRRVLNEEHWVLDIPDLPQPEEKYITEPSYTVIENLQYGRMSFKGFNPEIERIMRNENINIELDEAERREKEIAVSDDEMTERYKWLVGSMGKKFATKRQRAAMSTESGENSDEAEPKRQRTETVQEKTVRSAKKLKNKMRTFMKNVPADAGDKFVVECRRKAERLGAPPKRTGASAGKSKQKTPPKRQHTGPVMDSDEEDSDGHTARRRKRQFMKPQE